MKQRMNHPPTITRRKLLALSTLPFLGAPAAAAGAMKVAFVYVGPAAGAGWSFAHDQGRRAMEAALAGKVKSTFVENVPEGPDAEPVIRQLAADGNRLIFTTSSGYMSATEKVAAAFPRVIFENANGYKKAANMGNYETRMYEGAYLLGVVAGRMTRTNVVGMVGSVPVPDVIRNINAFALGAQSVNRKIRTKVAWVGAWHDPAREGQAAESLIAQGADILSQTTESPAPLQVAQRRGKFGFGWNADMARFAPKAQLVACTTHWDEYYADTARAVLNGAWKPREFKGGLKGEMIRFTSLNWAAPADLTALLDERRKQILSYAVRPFAGPLRDQDGHVRVSIGANMPARELIGLNWFVQGVEGTIPRS